MSDVIIEERFALHRAARSVDKERALSLLLDCFPFLDRKEIPGRDPWDAELLVEWWAKAPATDTERMAVAFALNVWNHRIEVPFDAMEALARWDTTNRRVFVLWAQDPWWA